MKQKDDEEGWGSQLEMQQYPYVPESTTEVLISFSPIFLRTSPTHSLFLLNVRSWIEYHPNRTYFPMIIDMKPYTHKGGHWRCANRILVEDADIAAIRELLLDV
ncbi:MAG TPA: hypothetical protein VGW09_00590 [Nitrososphaeraceae archaeon]|nr:hypothetical protein [Nitrososphaeraceae archaeon]